MRQSRVIDGSRDRTELSWWQGFVGWTSNTTVVYFTCGNSLGSFGSSTNIGYLGGNLGVTATVLATFVAPFPFAVLASEKSTANEAVSILPID